MMVNYLVREIPGLSTLCFLIVLCSNSFPFGLFVGDTIAEPCSPFQQKQ